MCCFRCSIIFLVMFYYIALDIVLLYYRDDSFIYIRSLQFFPEKLYELIKLHLGEDLCMHFLLDAEQCMYTCGLVISRRKDHF